MDEPATLYVRHWTVTNTVKRLKCGRAWRKGDVVVSACVKGNAAYVMVTAPNKYWPAHGKYMYTYMEAPRDMVVLLVDRLHGVAEELGVSMKDVASYILDRMLAEAKKKQKRRV
jgi:hypothetical protein